MKRKRIIFLCVFLVFMGITLFSEELVVNHIVIRGNNAFTRKELLDVLNIEDGKSYSNEEIKKRVSLLEDFYHERGYSIAEIEAHLDLDSNLILKIYEGFVKEVIFLKMNYLEVFLIRQAFGFYKNMVFYKPLMDEKLKKLSSISEFFNYEFIPVKGMKGDFYLFLSKKRKKSKDGKEKLIPYTDIKFNFRGWALSLVPYMSIRFYNLGGINHIFRLGVDVRFATKKWASLQFQESVINEYYTLDYFSVPIYNDLRINYHTAININREGRDDLKLDYKTIRFPFQIGVGYDFKYFWTALRGGYLYEKLRKLRYEDDTLVTFQEPFSYPELTKAKDVKYKYFSWRLSYTKKKRYIKEKDNEIKVKLDYYFNNEYSWFSFYFQTENFILLGDDIVVLRFRTVYMNGDYPVYYQFILPDEFHLRGYGEVATNRAMDGTFEIWNSLDEDFIHLIWALDAGWFNNLTYKEDIATGDFALSFGAGVSFSFKEMNLRFYYSLPIKQRVDRGRFDFFFRRRF